MTSFRKSAQLIFENIGNFGSGYFLDWQSALQMIADLADAPQSSTFVPQAEIVALRQVSGWGAFYQALAQHRLFSEHINAEEIVQLWDRIRGFDIDTLLDIGNPEGLAARRDEEVSARYAVGRRVAETPFRVDRSILADEHVHFGQIVDLGLLWHWHLREAACHWSRYGPRLDLGRRFRSGERTLSRERALPHSVARWAACMARARLLFAYACIHPELLHNNDEGASDFIHKVLECAEGNGQIGDNDLSALEQLQQSLLLKAADISIGQSIVKERNLVAALAVSDVSPLARAYAAAYVTLKSAAMHAVCGNAVAGQVDDRFSRFTKALGALDHIYSQRRRAFEHTDSFVTVSRAQLEMGSKLLPRVLFRASRTSMSLGKESHLRRLANQWRTARELFENKHSKLILSFHRADFVTDAAAFQDIATAIIKNRNEWESELFCSIVGLDLCGPESLDINATGSQYGEEAPTRMILDPIDRIFELRERLMSNGGDPIYVSFHAGEHVVDWELGFLATLAIVTDPRFNAETDRLSHALILCVPPNKWRPTSDATQSARGAARDRVRRNCTRESGPLFSSAERTRIVDALDGLLKGDLAGLEGICDEVRGKVILGKIAVEICPYSNLMLRDIPPEQHPWLDALVDGRVFVGTDDPSLTQTLPWVEHAALDVGRRERERRATASHEVSAAASYEDRTAQSLG